MIKNVRNIEKNCTKCNNSKENVKKQNKQTTTTIKTKAQKRTPLKDTRPLKRVRKLSF